MNKVASDKQIKKVLDAIPDGVVIADLDGVITLANKAAEKILGLKKTQIVGRTYDDPAWKITSADGKPLAREELPIARIITTGKPVRDAEIAVEHPDRRRILLSVNGTPLLDEAGTQSGAVVSFNDITRLKRMQELSDALNEINVSINSTLDFDEIMKRVIERSAKAMHAETAAIDLRKGGYWIVSYLYGLPDTLIGTRFTDSESRHSVIATETKKPFVSDDAFNDKRLNPEVVRKFNLRSILVIPLIVKDEVIGVLFFSYHTEPVNFSSAEVDFATKLAASISLALENAQIYSAEHQIAETLQSALLIIPECIDGIEFGHLYRSATESAKVGGDFYDIFELDDRMVGIIVGDVSGKGIGAAALTAMVKNSIKAHAYEDCVPSSVMAKANDLVLRASPDDTFVTVFFGLLDIETGQLIYCSAGHPPALIKRASGGVDILSDSSPIIGAFPHMRYRDGRQVLEKGDILVVYTDGLTEARCKFGFFGEERLATLLNGLKHESAPSIPLAIVNKIMDCAGGVLLDDVALLAVELADK